MSNVFKRAPLFALLTALTACIPPSGGGGSHADSDAAADRGPTNSGTGGTSADGADGTPPPPQGGTPATPPQIDGGAPPLPDADVPTPTDATLMDASRTRPDSGPGANCVTETCNGIDDDCDGRTDEEYPEFGADCVGEIDGCAAVGLMTCRNGVLECQGQKLIDGPEECNGEDDDCDGEVDENAAANGEACFIEGCFVESELRCQGGQYACVPAGAVPPELCNGGDDDCDGRIDEEAIDVGDPCEEFLPDTACLGGGSTQCVDGEPICRIEGVLDAPRDALCNGEDEDCDGRLDEHYSVTPCVLGVGACAVEGQTRCSEGREICDGEPSPPTPERCNGIDDDCDGRSDEDGVCGVPPGDALQFRGVRDDLTEDAVLDGGFRQCYSDLYGAPFSLDRMLRACNLPTVLVACRRVNSGTFTTAAMGVRNRVFVDTPCNRTAHHTTNGVDWYMSRDCSFGYAPEDSELSRSSCDTTPGPDRLCWHTEEVGGYRCGAQAGLNNDNGWERVVFHR